MKRTNEFGISGEQVENADKPDGPAGAAVPPQPVEQGDAIPTDPKTAEDKKDD